MKENLVVTCSGGETSMVVTLYCLKYLKDKYNILIVYANTGVESNKTLDFLKRCQDELNVPIKWIEAKVYHGKRKSCGYTEVTYESATRNTDWKHRDDTPFEEIIKKYGLPNHSRLHCTRELKMNPIKSFAKDYFTKLNFEQWLLTQSYGKECLDTFKSNDWKGWDKSSIYNYYKNNYKEYGGVKPIVKYTLALGIRVDEIDRINPKRKELGIIYPLAQTEYKPMTKKQVNFFWEMQPFRLELKGYEGNCITCYKKSNNKLYQIAQENPEAFGFFALMEDKYGNTNGKVPQKIWEEVLSNDGSLKEVSRLEVLPKEDYKNTIFRNFKTARDIINEAKNFDKKIIDDHIETESCEIFSNCGEI